MKEITVTLSKPLKYSTKGGEFEEESVLVLRSPNTQGGITRTHARRLRSLGLSALRTVQKNVSGMADGSEGAPEAVESKGSDLIMMFEMGGVDTNEIISAMKKLAPSVVTIGEDIPFKESHWDRLTMEDEEEITGRYLSDFLLNFNSSETKS